MEKTQPERQDTGEKGHKTRLFGRHQAEVCKEEPGTDGYLPSLLPGSFLKGIAASAGWFVRMNRNRLAGVWVFGCVK